MVMPNQHDGASSSGWWDDLPPSIKKRISRPEPKTPADSRSPDGPDESYRPAVVRDLSRFAMLFLGVALANLLFLLLALSFLVGRGPIGP